MMLGKRPRPVRRTTSMTEFTLDLDGLEGPPSDQGMRHNVVTGGHDGYLAAASPMGHPRSSGDYMETAPFLRICEFCKRRLVPGRDIYMYRGDTAFCSSECRQKQMNMDERKEKCSLTSIKKETTPATPATSAAGSEASSGGETVTAA
ncbi:hypothetical protein QJS04_geneDACA014445 [Acorus gramineus]|uniref:FLZ-type domain-containing protein n=1 Tax=Acorus gramineus TaxID=55184 RepID=A0AAV9BPR6_ACOGR|nr:hypothetical protein QJS04_geneDACA014445 [Acorus gramineus]